ncbi:hypothetical protein B7P43_G06344 [Cryptotermes secundus]|uniref:Uncharacterized protein n=1 Tax=Cryptotermes secundus TaxID=105785 RepID=A0A2J7PSQ5_9NEOP|nr:hypothetical protein B7P43_G06344 [Cryptotermes secundus]
MSTPQKQVPRLLWLAELQFLTAAQCRFGTQYGRQPPTRKSIRFWENKLRTTGSLLLIKSPGKIQTSEENVIRIKQAFQRSPRKLIHPLSLKLAYKIQMIHALKPSDQVTRTKFPVDMLEGIDASPEYRPDICHATKRAHVEI